MSKEIEDLLEKALEVFSWCQENADEKWMVDHLALVRKNIDQALTKLREAKCKTCDGHGGAINCPKCNAQICWIDIDPEKEGFIRCRRCGTPHTKFIKKPCPDCKAPKPNLWLTKDYLKKALNRWDIDGKHIDGKHWVGEALKIIEGEAPEPPPAEEKVTLGDRLKGSLKYCKEDKTLYLSKLPCPLCIQARLDTSEANLKDLLGALKRYGHHDSPCAGILDLNEDSGCTCGFAAAIAKAKERE